MANNNEYWEKRAIEDMLMSERSVIGYMKDLKDAYTNALAEIKKQIDAFYQRYATNNSITYTEARRRLQSKDFNEFQAIIKSRMKTAKLLNLSSVYQNYLESLSKQQYITKLESLEANIRHEIEILESYKINSLPELMSINYEFTWYNNIYRVAQSTGVEVKFNSVDAKGVQKAVVSKWGNYSYSQAIWSDRDKLTQTLKTIIPQSFSMGRNSNQLGDMIAKEMNVSQNRGRTLARTEINRICNDADFDTYKFLGVKEYQYLATLDWKTSEICRSMDGKVFKVNERQTGVNCPPLHPNCRSTTVPYLGDEELENLTRVAKDWEGNTITVPRRMSQEEYIKTYAPEDQQERLLRFLKKNKQ